MFPFSSLSHNSFRALISLISQSSLKFSIWSWTFPPISNETNCSCSQLACVLILNCFFLTFLMCQSLPCNNVQKTRECKIQDNNFHLQSFSELLLYSDFSKQEVCIDTVCYMWKQVVFSSSLLVAFLHNSEKLYK